MKRHPANYRELSIQLSQKILPTAEAALSDLEDILQNTELNAANARNLIAAQRELSKACKLINIAIAIAACRLEVD